MMGKLTITGLEERTELPKLLEGHQHGLGETCHTLWARAITLHDERISEEN